MLLVPDPQVNVVNDSDRADDALVIPARAVEDDRVTSSQITVDGTADIYLADRVAVRELLDKIRGRLVAQDGIREEARVVIRIDWHDECSRPKADEREREGWRIHIERWTHAPYQYELRAVCPGLRSVLERSEILEESHETLLPGSVLEDRRVDLFRSEERRVGKECRSR